MSDGSGGYLLALLTDSFAVRAMIGTLAALLLALLTIKVVHVRSALARRVLVLAPVVTVAIAAVASIGGQFIPTLMVMGSAAEPDGAGMLDVLGESRQMSEARSVGYLLAAYGVVAVVLLTRRMLGAARVRALLRRADDPGRDDRPARVLRRVASDMRMPVPRLRLVPDCPGGAFAAGRRAPVIALDPALALQLDDGELQGLLAHELAHIRRADPLTGLLVGVVRDLAFFLPGVHVAARWLCVEQEHSADEFAAASTGRPGALASGLLKVWHSGSGHRRRLPAGACAAAGSAWGHRARMLAGSVNAVASAGQAAWAGVTPWSGRDAVAVITQRIERLIGGQPRVSTRRQRWETAAAVSVTALAATTALSAPAWFSDRHADLVGFFYLSSDTAVEAESPAMATFRTLSGAGAATAGTALADDAAPAAVGAPAQADGAPERAARQESAAACPCIASPSQLAAAQSGAPGERPTTTWGARGWTLQSLRHQADLEATRRLLLMDSTAQQMGFLTAGRSAPDAAARRAAATGSWEDPAGDAESSAARW